jgi:serine protease Do
MTSHTDIVANKNDKIPWYVYFVGGVIVVDGAAKISVMFHDGTRVPAELIGSDRETDRALLHVVLPKGPHNHAQLGDSDKLEVGQKVLAIGHPFGLAYALANVVISGLGKLAETNQDVSHERIIQTTAPINPGNSGGPLMDSADQVIGINTVILMDAENIAFVIPINTVKSIVTALQGSSRVIRPWLDVKGKFVTEELRNLMALPLFSGLLIMDVDDGSPAEKIGLQAGQLSVTIEGEPWVLGGDILTAVNEQTVTNTEQYTKVLQALQADQMIEMPVFKDGAYHAMSVKLGERPTAPKPQHRPRIQVPPFVPQGFTPAGF